MRKSKAINLNISKDIQAVNCIEKSIRSTENRFQYKLTMKNYDNMLDVLVLMNNICVLQLKHPIDNNKPLKSVSFNVNIDEVDLSGKRKKGSQNIIHDSKILDITLTNGDVISYYTPIGGKLLEINKKIIDDPSILNTSIHKIGYICIIQPNTAIPSIDGARDYTALYDSLIKSRDDKLCHAWLNKGECSRGDSCKFLHNAISQEFESIDHSNDTNMKRQKSSIE